MSQQQLWPEDKMLNSALAVEDFWGVLPEPFLHMWCTLSCLPGLCVSSLSHGLSIFQTALQTTNTLDHSLKSINHCSTLAIMTNKDDFVFHMLSTPQICSHGNTPHSTAETHTFLMWGNIFFMWYETSDLCPPGICRWTHQRFLDSRGIRPSGGSSMKTLGRP